MNTNHCAPPGKIPLDYQLWLREISNREFAKQVGVHDSEVSRWRNGLLPPRDKRRLIARKLKMTEAELGWEEAARV